MLGLILKLVFEDYKNSINNSQKIKIPLFRHYYLVGKNRRTQVIANIFKLNYFMKANNNLQFLTKLIQQI